MGFLETLLITLGSGAAAGLIAWGGIKTEIRWLRADLKRVEATAQGAQASAGAAHSRLDRIDAPPAWNARQPD